jgi:hypothetical protein
MIEHVLHPRTENKDWATVLFVLAFAILLSQSQYMKTVLVTL